MFETESYASVYTMADLEHKKILTDKCAMHFYELPKLDKEIDSGNRKKLWMQLINSESEAELNMLKQTNIEAIKDGADVIFRLSDDKDVRDMAERREDALRIEKSALYHAEARGMAQGIERGMAQGKADMLRGVIEELRKLGVSEDVIENVTNL